ncbi:37S ribosomal protein S22 [Imshaugia aleurites]|uniref:37S ribosomal protein S22 n=1 Tax=Imshaugia aleurites TaxID=172621 RepID=A0A8H3G2B2_9LECA|nr:37S ribosomal protein S22 [Imshaugia aleurites]
MESIVRQARETFGETLPKNFLSSDEYTVYERLYGPPSATTLLEDFDLLRGVDEEEDAMPANVLMRENAEGTLEEVIYEGDPLDEDEVMEEDAEPMPSETEADFQARMAVFRDIAAANALQAKTKEESTQNLNSVEPSDDLLPPEELAVEDEEAEDSEQDEEAYGSGDSARTHPLTLAGRFSTSPATIQIPNDAVVDPITALLADASNKQLSEVAQRTFGGPGLPNSTATIVRANLKQQPIALEASQSHMGEMEGNAYIAAIMPGAYATVMSTLVEIRKRLGSEWLRKLMKKKGGPRVLDAGAGGAAILAWREILRAEWEFLGHDPNKPPPYGKSTVVTGSSALRNRASHLLDDTTFIPRLPDYDPSRDHPSLENKNPQGRKQYDVIVAPHTLWTLKEDYIRKNQIQNFWSLLDPKGGVLVLIEKGVPRGFELIAGARETLLKHHIASPGDEEVEAPIEAASRNRFGSKEKGMIIAPCTNHGKCPMYITAGRSQGRKDYCHFSQRYIRPHYLQRILGSRDKNHEDISFSYVALRRGIDQREAESVMQGQAAVEAAFAGFEDKGGTESTEGSPEAIDPRVASVSTLSLPRAILPPIKRRGHVILDLCTPAGKIERWTVPKSFSKQAYRDARKSKWGDLWALGAKTRVQRNIRVGLNKAKTQRKDILNAAEETDDIRDIQAPKFAAGKRSKKTKPKQQTLEDDY